MIVLVTGGRDYGNRPRVFEVLDGIHAETPITLVVHGACNEPHRPWILRGADRWAQEWALCEEVEYAGFPAAWKTHGKSAGPLRNDVMVNTVQPNRVIAFPGGSGTRDCVSKALRAGIPVTEISE